MNLRNTKLITHRGCMDGSSCAILFLICGGRKENISFCGPNHSEVDEVAKDAYYNHEGPIIFADISISETVAELLCGRNDILLFDHHKTAIPLAKHSWCEIDIKNERCGSKIFYDWCLNVFAKNDEHLYYKLNEYDKFIEVIDDIDRWKNLHKVSKCFSRLNYVLGQNLFIERFVNNHSIELTDRELYIVHIELQKEEQYVEDRKSNLHIRQIISNGKSYAIGFVECWKYQSELADAICSDLNLNLDAIVMVGTHSISLRKRNHSCDLDLSVISSLNGGGGHAAAAGTLLRNVLGFDVVEKVMENMKWN